MQQQINFIPVAVIRAILAHRKRRLEAQKKCPDSLSGHKTEKKLTENLKKKEVESI